MNPIPTTNAMKPAPGKGVSSFPTPVIKDTVIVEVVNAWKGDYQPLEYGTKWDDVPHASVQGSFPDHKLINQAPNSEDGQFVKRIWANDRVDQDTYNYAIKYSGGSDAHPIYIRTYVELRETYAPVPDLSPDPLFPNAKLVEEEVQREDSELDSRYVKVIRTYETLPGPIISSQRVNERGDLETVNVQTVDPNTPPDPDGLLVTQTQVLKEDVSKGTKTTATVPSHTQLLIKEKKDGLLGETITTDDIVDPATNPDNLSTTIVASTVQQVSATKAVKRTTTSSGPSFLFGGETKEGLLGNTSIIESIVPAGSDPLNLSTQVVASRVDPIDSSKSKRTTVVSDGPNSLTQKSKDGKLLGDVTVTESIVFGNDSPDNPTGVTSGILSSEIKQVAQGRAIKRNTFLNSTPTLNGSESKGGLLGNTTTQETIVAAGTQATQPTLNIIASSVEPIDATRSRRVVVTASGPTTLSGKQSKDGLLGETTITESIVAAGSNPDQLSQSVLSSEVTPIDAAKSKKTTIISTGPTTLSGRQNKEGLLGYTTVTESIVAAGESPDPISYTVVSSEVTPIDSFKSKKTTVESTGPTSLSTAGLFDSPVGLVIGSGAKKISSPGLVEINGNKFLLSARTTQIDQGKTLVETTEAIEYPTIYGVDYDEVIGAPVSYQKSIVSPDEYKNPSNWKDNANTEIEPIDQWKSLRKAYDVDKIRAAYLEQYYVIETQIDVSLPDKLLAAGIYWSKDNGEGFASSDNPEVSGDSYSYSESYTVESSANVSGDVFFRIEKGFSGSIPGSQHIFFLPIDDGKVDKSILNALNEISGKNFQKWPNIKRVTENIVIISGSKTKSESYTKGESVSINGFSKNDRKSTSFSINREANTIVVPDTIHGDIPISIEEVGTFGDVQPPEYSIFPTVLSSTEISRFPTGEYLIDATMELYKYGLVRVTARTVNITSEYI